MIGEGELTLPFILEKINEKLELPEIVKEAAKEGLGAATIYNNTIYISKNKKNVNLDEIKALPINRGIVGPIEIMRGCPWGCKYCQVSYMFGFSPRFRSPENICYWIKQVIRLKHSLNKHADIRFVAPDSFSYGRDPRNKKEYFDIFELFEKLIKIKKEYSRTRIFFGTFPSEVRPDSVSKEIVKEIKKFVDNKSLIMGVQTASNKLLKHINRGHTLEDAINAIEIINNEGFLVELDFIFGLPGETKEDREITLNVIENIIKKYKVRIHLHTFMPLPGTPFDSEPPGKLDHEIKKRIYKLIGKGLVYGQWEKQEIVAKKIDELRKSRTIITTKTLKEMLDKGEIKIKIY